MTLEKKLKDSAFVIGTNTSSCWVVRLSRVNEELGVVAQEIDAEIDNHLDFDIDSDRIINPATIHQIKDELKKRIRGLLMEREESH